MRVQLDSFEDNGMAILSLYPEGRQSFGVPRELLPEDARAGGVLEASLAHDREENRRLLDDLLRRDCG
jgi:hypothetical protein